MAKDMEDAVGAPSGAPASSVDLSDLVAIAEVIRGTRKDMLDAKARPKPRSSIWASQIPDCARQGVYEFTHWDQRKPWDAAVQAKIDTGHWVEDATLSELTEIGRQAGFKVVEQQAHLSSDMGLQYGIHGRTDAKIEWTETRKRYPVEIKKVASHIFNKIRDGIEGLDDMRGVWFMRKYVRQLMVNLLGQNFDRGFFVLVNAENGAWKIIPVVLDYDLGESSLQMAKTIDTHRKAGTQPDRIAYDMDVCGHCNYIHVCMPDIKNSQSIKLIDDSDIQRDLDELEVLKPQWSKYERLWKKLKASMVGVADAVAVGNWVMQNRTGTTTKYKVPEEIKARYMVKEPTETLKVIRIDSTTDPESE